MPQKIGGRRRTPAHTQPTPIARVLSAAFASAHTGGVVDSLQIGDEKAARSAAKVRVAAARFLQALEKSPHGRRVSGSCRYAAALSPSSFHGCYEIDCTLERRRPTKFLSSATLEYWSRARSGTSRLDFVQPRLCERKSARIEHVNDALAFMQISLAALAAFRTKLALNSDGKRVESLAFD